MKRPIAIATLLAVAALVAWLTVDRAIERDAMTALAGKVLMVGFDGRAPDDRGVRRTLGQLRRGEIAGVMFLRRNVRDERQVKRLNRALAEAASGPLIALDQEGGRIVRLGRRSGFPRTPAALVVADRLTPAEARDLYAEMARGLADWGFNLNFGPVVDLHEPSNPIIGRLGRAFSAEPETVTAYARAFIEAHRAAGLLTAIKHFPGHGSSRGDTHLGAVDVTPHWRPAELEPFRALAAVAPMVMTGHIVNRTFDDGPATLSRALIDDRLRGYLGFRGAVVSDDLQMDAIADREPIAAEKAMRAGVDLLLFANDGRIDPSLVSDVAEHLAAVARRDAAFAARLREAGARIDVLRATISRSATATRAPDRTAASER